jgi:hypothetical protein
MPKMEVLLESLLFKTRICAQLDVTLRLSAAFVKLNEVVACGLWFHSSIS